MTDIIKQLSDYLKVPEQKNPEFWNTWRISHIRELSTSGRSCNEIFTPPEARTGRRLDRFALKKGESVPIEEIDTSASFPDGYSLTIPLYLGDMSFGALSGVPNIAIARAADSTGVIAGTGEGGLLPEIEDCRNITVQWASGRFGVTAEKLRKGRGVVIKVGQGAKPGIGGHLPGAKVTEEISEARRIPAGIDAISPAPHHDIYSIEDLGRRIKALKIITGKPVFVKVAATNYIPFIASGIARMGGAGVIIDGFGAGTGAAPVVVRDNLGMPVEDAVESAHRALIEEGLRDNFIIVAGGRVSTPEDMVKLICLGADYVTLGTAPLISMGCLMVHKCHHGSCPALLTNRLSDKRPPMSLDFAQRSLENMVEGWRDETKRILSYMGVRNLGSIRGRRDLLEPVIYEQEEDEQTPEEKNKLRMIQAVDRVLALSGISGNRAAAPPISSMGSTMDPSLTGRSRIIDRLIIDGAQVTRPSLDPHRERIDTSWSIDVGARAIIPVFISLSYESDENISIHSAAGAMSVPVMRESDLEYGHWKSKVHVIPSSREIPSITEDPRESGLRFILIDETLPESDESLEISLSRLDRMLREKGFRNEVHILVQPSSLRGAEDIVKLLCLGASAVGINAMVCIAIQRGISAEVIENLISGIRRELKLLSGAAGVGLVSNTLTGNRELLRGVGVSRESAEVLDIKETAS